MSRTNRYYTMQPHSARPIFGWYYWPARDMNVLILLVIVLCAVSHLVQTIKARRALRRSRQLQYTRLHHRTDSSYDRVKSPASTQQHRSALYCYSVELGNWLYLAIFPKWMYAPESLADALWSGLYCGVLAFYCYYRTPSIPGDPYPYRRFANMCGVMAYAQTPIVFLLAVKNNPLQPLIGITYQKLNYMHRASARACILASWVHTVLWIPPLWNNDSMLAFYVIMGYLALAGFTGLWLFSLRVVRRRMYELFMLSHIVLSIAFIIGACLHWPRKAYWIWPSILVWAVDRSIRLLKRLSCNWSSRRQLNGASGRTTTIELVSKDVMRVVIRRKGLEWAAGQHFFLTAPSIPGMPHESHPFSVSNVPPSSPHPPTSPFKREEVDAIFLIRAHSGFTSHLLSSISSSSTTPIPLELEGPYGHDHPLEHYSTVVLVAGGTGVTFCLSYFMRLLQPFATLRGLAGTQGEAIAANCAGSSAENRLLAGAGRAQPTCLRRLKLIWHVRKVEDVEWIAPMLNTALDSLGGDALEVDVSVDVYVTRALPEQALYLTGPHDSISSGTSRSATLAHRIAIDSPAQDLPPIGTSFGITLTPPLNAHNVYEGSSAEGLAEPFRSGRYPLAEMCTTGTPIAQGNEAYAEDPDDGTDADPLLAGATCGTGASSVGGGYGTGARRTEMSGSLTSGYGSTGSSSRDRSQSSSTLCSLEQTHKHEPSIRPAHVATCAARHTSSLSPAARTYIRLHPGRADLPTTIPSIADGNEADKEDGGDMIVVTCGPVPLMHDARRAVWAANSKERIRQGRKVVHLLEETVGH